MTLDPTQLKQWVGDTTKDRQRRAWVIQYCRADQRNDVTREVYDDRPWVVRGGIRMQELHAECGEATEVGLRRKRCVPASHSPEPPSPCPRVPTTVMQSRIRAS